MVDTTLQILDKVKNTLDVCVDKAEPLLCEKPFSNIPVVLMVSGGSDSTALAYLAYELRRGGILDNVCVVHINHKLRAKDSDDDEIFVRELSKHLGFDFFIKQVDVAVQAKSCSENVESCGRRIRYEFARQVLSDRCKKMGVRFEDGRIFTAHTQDDRVENFYMRSIVGTGPGGFKSIDYAYKNVVHPLLNISKTQLRDYISGLQNALVIDGQRWREDVTNAQTNRFRSFVRHEIVPLAKQKNPALLDTLCRSMDLIADEDKYMQQVAYRLSTKLLQWEEVDDNKFSRTTKRTNANGNQDENSQGEAEGENIKPNKSDCENKTFDFDSDCREVCVILPQFAKVDVVLQRRIVFDVLKRILKSEETGVRVENLSVQSILDACENNAFKSGYVANIQGNIAVSSNKKEIRIEPMSVFRKRRNRL